MIVFFFSFSNNRLHSANLALEEKQRALESKEKELRLIRHELDASFPPEDKIALQEQLATLETQLKDQERLACGLTEELVTLRDE